jgi:signal transduction histidine kinase
MNSIRRQLTRNVLAVALLLLGGGLVAMYVAAHIALLRQFDVALRAKALAISTLTVNAGGEIRVNFTDEFFRGFDDDSPRDFFTLWRADGGQVAKSESLRRRELPRPEGKFKGTRYWNLSLPNGRPGRAIAYSFEPEGTDRRGEDVEVQLAVATDRHGLNETLQQLAGLAGICGVLLLGGTLLIVPLVLKRGLRPLERLGEQASQIDARSLGARFPVNELPAELQPIAGRLNELLGRIEQSFDRERRFSADLAHELRTPLAELRSMAESALKWPDTRDATLDRDTLAIALQMEGLVTSMLMLARGENEQLASQLESTPLASVVEETWRPFATRAEAKGLRVKLELAPVNALADAALLRTVLVNLFDNAVEYTPAGGEIAIRVSGEGTRTTIRVENPTDNLMPADAERLFERFWRKDPARSGGQHFGLGLALAATCAQAMGWTLTATVDESHLSVILSASEESK